MLLFESHAVEEVFLLFTSHVVEEGGLVWFAFVREEEGIVWLASSRRRMTGLVWLACSPEEGAVCSSPSQPASDQMMRLTSSVTKDMGS